MNFTRRYGSSGNTLIEALIGTLLMSIVFVGSVSVLNRTLVTQRYVNTQNIVLMEMREAIMGTGVADVCSSGASSIPVGNSHQLALAAPTCTSAALANVGIAGQLEAIPANSVPATAMTWQSAGNAQTRALIGGDGVFRLSF